MTNISNLGLTQLLTTGLLSQQTTLSTLTQQLSSGNQYDNLTQYDPTEAHNILDFQNGVTQRQAYVSSITNVQARLTTYNSTMSDMENIAAQANSLASENSSYSATTAADLKQQATDYLKEITDDLNQQVGGRYIYAGTRYTTQPVTDLTTLTTAPTATTTTGNVLPSYDTDFNNATSFSVNTMPTGTFTMGTTKIAWSGLEGTSATSPVTVTVNGSPQTVAVTGLSTGTTAADYASNLVATLNAVALSTSASSSGIPSTLTASASGSPATTVTLNLGGATPNAVTPDAGGLSQVGETTWTNGSIVDGTVQQTPNTSAAAYTQDTALIDSNYSVTYGISSDNPGFQQLINGVRFINSAVAAGQSGDTATYQSDMQQASTLIGNGLAGIQTLNAGVADNQNILSQETSTQNTDITSLQDQLSNIQQVNLTQVGTEINLLQTQLQASYSATASLQQLSLVKYL